MHTHTNINKDRLTPMNNNTTVPIHKDLHLNKQPQAHTHIYKYIKAYIHASK